MIPEAEPQCALCLENRPLCESHIIPAFVGRYLKDTSATGYLRAAEKSNLRVQDLPTEKLLCAQCELQFSRWEDNFSRDGFQKIHSEGYDGFEYDPSLMQFAVSVSWRILCTDRDELLQDFPDWGPKILKTLETWRKYLLGACRDSGGEHHLFVIPGTPGAMPTGAHPKTSQYLLRCVDATELIGKRTLAVYAKLVRAIFYSPIMPASPSGLHRTRIYAGAGRIVTPQKLTVSGFGGFLQSRVQDGFCDELSERQLERIRETVRKNPRRALESESLRMNDEAHDLWNIATKAIKEQKGR